MNLPGLFAALGVPVAIMYVLPFYAGPLLVSWRGSASPAPEWVAEYLPAESPPALVVERDDFPMGGIGPPGFRRLVFSSVLLDENADDLPGEAALAVGAFETYAFDAALFGLAFRLEALLFLIGFLLQSAQVDRSLLVVGGAVAVTVGLVGLVDRFVRWRYRKADEWAAERVGVDVVRSRLADRADMAPGWFPELLRFRPSTDRRLRWLPSRRDAE